MLEVFKSKHLQAYEKEYWKLIEGIITSEDHQDYLFDKRERMLQERVEVNSLKLLIEAEFVDDLLLI